jgi:hypothetical protein
VAGLDTVKYTPQNFSEKAAKAIDDAIAATSQSNVTPLSPDQVLEAFLLSQRLLVVPINTEGDRNLYELGRPLGFNMLMTFDGMQYVYFGNFTALRPEAVVWRIKTLNEIIAARMSSLPDRVKMGLATPIQVSAIQTVLKALRVWALVTSSDQKKTVLEALANESFPFQTNILAMPEMAETLQNIF